MAYGDNTDPTAPRQQQAKPVATDPAVNAPGSDAWNKSVGDIYQTALGRAPSAAELASHAGNPGGLEGIKSTIYGSTEGQAYKAAPPATAATPASDSVAAWVGKQAGGAGINPSVGSDPNYWIGRINETSMREPGGFNAAAQNYWTGLMQRPEGAPEGGGGPAGSPGSPGGAAPPGATMTPEGTWITAQTDPGKWVDNKGQNWSLGPDGKPVKEGASLTTLGGLIPGGTATPGGIGTRNPQWDAFYQQLLGRSNQSLAVNPNDPVIRAQTEAFRNEQTRGERQNLASIAESAGPNTNIGAEQRHAGEAVGQNTAAFQAQLMGREVDSRRQEIAQALAGMQGQLTSEETSRLRQEDQALQKRQQDLGNTLSYAQLDLQKELARQGATQAQWLRAFQDRGWTADQAQRAWQNNYSNNQQLLG